MAEKKTAVDAILEALGEFRTLQELTDVTGYSKVTISNALTTLVDNGTVERVGYGKYQLATNGSKRQLVETEPARNVELAPFLKGRAAHSVWVEQAPIELENVVRLELCIKGQYVPLMLTGEIRVCVGEEIPRWHAAQEMIAGVSEIRVTFATGKQATYPHNPAFTLTIAPKE